MLHTLNQTDEDPPQHRPGHQAAGHGEQQRRRNRADAESIGCDSSHREPVDQERARIVQQALAFENCEDAAAAASGGATRAPSASAAAQGISGTRARATSATPAVVNPTANTTSSVSPTQLSLRPLRDASYAASSSAGAMKSASTSSGAE